jgi:hypothetical protein
MEFFQWLISTLLYNNSCKRVGGQLAGANKSINFYLLIIKKLYVLLHKTISGISGIQLQCFALYGSFNQGFEKRQFTPG